MQSQKELTRRDIEVALGCLERAVHAGTSDAEVLAAIGAWRRKTGHKLVREVCEGYFGAVPRRSSFDDGRMQDRRLAAENIWLKDQVANWRREAEKWHEEYERIFGVLSRAETKRLYDKVAQRHRRGRRVAAGLFGAVDPHREVLVALASCAFFIALFLAAKWFLFHALPHP